MKSSNLNTIQSFFKRTLIVFLILSITLLCIAASRSETNTFIVYEGKTKTVYNSTHKNTSDFLNEAGIIITDDKYAEMPETAENGLAKIYILKKNVITLQIDGETKTLYALSEKTISDVLSDNGIVLGPEDTVSVPLTDAVSDGLSFEVKRYSHKTVEEYKEIPFDTEKRPSFSMDKGTSKVITKGVPGSKKLVYNVKTENGVEIERSLVSETVVKSPVTKVVEYGTREVDKSGAIATASGQKLEYKKVISMTATAYTTERSSDKITATGKVASVGLVAVDPKVIPLGSKLYICSPDGKSWVYGTAVAADTGVRGNRIDLFFNTYKECINFGRRKATVYVLK